MITALEDYGVKVTTFDPWAKPEEVMHEYGIETIQKLPSFKYDALVLGVSHKEFADLDIATLTKETNVVYDVKGFLKGRVDGRL